MCQDGLQISGVGTIGLNLLMHDPLCHLLYLNVDEKLPIFLQKETRFYHLRSSKSHDPILVANKLTEIVNQCKSPKVTILPNTGDTNYGAAMECLRNNLDKPGKRLAILGIVHGDQKNPYEVIRHYEPSINCFAGISTWCRDRLKEYIPHQEIRFFGYLGSIDNRFAYYSKGVPPPAVALLGQISKTRQMRTQII